MEKFTNTFFFSDSSIRMTEVRQSERAWNSCLLFCEIQMFSQRIACSVQISQDTFFTSIFPCSMWELRMFSQIYICPVPFLCSHADLKAKIRSLGWTWPVSSGVFFSILDWLPTFCPFAFLCSGASSACVSSLASGQGILSSSFRFHWQLHGPFKSIRSCILSCVWNRNKTPILGGVQRKMMGTQMAASLMTLLLFKASASSEKCGFRILY